jgi:opacity protein-like surface antigen
MNPYADALRCAAAAAILSLLSPSAAQSADMPDFSSRFIGASAPINWEGVIVAAQVGITNFNANFENTAIPSAATPLSGQQYTTGRQLGGLIGYNSQWDGVVLGAELGYNKASRLSTSQTVGVVSGSITLNDYATARVRAGYPTGQFLPYAFLGGALGRFDYAVSNGAWSDSRAQAFALGFTGGLGADVMILPSMFLRGEWEYTVFTKVAGIRTNTNTARAAIGWRF